MENRIQFMSAIISTAINEYQIRSICDYGCGNGELLGILHQKHPQLKICGIDYFDGRYPDLRETDVPFRMIDRSSSDYDKTIADQHFDMVVSTFALHHFQYPVQELRNVSELVRPSGILELFDHAVDLDSQGGVTKGLSTLIWEIFDALKGRYHRHHYTLKEALDLLSAVPVDVCKAVEIRLKLNPEKNEEQRQRYLTRLSDTRSKMLENLDEYWQSIFLPLLDLDRATVERYGMDYSKIMHVRARKRG